MTILERIKHKVFKFLPIFIIVGVLIFLFLPVKITHKLETAGKILPAREWFLVSGLDGRIVTVLQNNLTGTTEAYSITQVERGDAMKFTLNPTLSKDTIVTAGDTIGVIYSNVVERELAMLNGELADALASLRFYQTGEKNSIVREAEHQLKHAIEQAEEQKRIVQRLENLYQRNLISGQEYELAKSTSELYDINVSIARSRLETVRSGAKKEQLEMIVARIESLQKEIATLQKRLELYTLISPLNGQLLRAFGSDTLVSVAETDSFVVLMPIKWRDRTYIKLHQKVTIKVPDVNTTISAQVIRIAKMVQTTNGSQFIYATALLSKNDVGLFPGLLARCTIECEPQKPIFYLKRILG